jgi:hypothetical protein
MEIKYSWHALIFYIMTGRISFLPLKSTSINEQTLQSSAVSERLQDCPGEPAPCSAKSMYRLADEVLTVLSLQCHMLLIVVCIAWTRGSAKALTGGHPREAY